MVHSLNFTFKRNILTCDNSESIYSGSIDISQATFNLDETWDGYLLTAVWSNEDDEIEVPVVGNSCGIPWEVLATPNKVLSVGIRGIKGEKVYPSNYCTIGIVPQGARSGDQGKDPTPDVYHQFLEGVQKSADNAEKAAQNAEEARIQAENSAASAAEAEAQAIAAKEVADSVRADADAGKFDGKVIFATFEVDIASGDLIMRAPDDYDGPEFFIENNNLKVRV